MTSTVKMFLLLCISAFFGIIAAPSANAASYTDHMDSDLPDEIRTYYNLSMVAVPNSGGWGSLSDKTFLSLSQHTQPVGRAVYNVQGAERLTVGIYTHTGSFVYYSPEKELYLLGFDLDTGIGNQRPALSQRALYSPSKQIICTNMSGDVRKAVYDGRYEFPEPDATEKKSLEGISDFIPYGVNVYASADGVSFARVSLSPGAVEFKTVANYCYEEFSCVLPSGAKQVMIELNDAPTYFDALTGVYKPKTVKSMASLALAVFDGSGLVMGPPKTETPAPVESSDAYQQETQSSQASSLSSASSSKTSSSKSSSSKSSSAANRSAAAVLEDEINSKAASSKFEGSIVISSSTGSAKSSASAQTRSTSPKKEGDGTSADSQPEDSIAAPNSVSQSGQLEPTQALTEGGEVIVYAQAEKSSGDRFTIAVAGYIAAIFAVILVVLIRSNKKN